MRRFICILLCFALLAMCYATADTLDKLSEAFKDIEFTYNQDDVDAALKQIEATQTAYKIASGKKVVQNAQADADVSSTQTSLLTDSDLTELSLSKLIELREEIQAAMWASDEWQEVEVPTGFYRVGKDIPAGHWTITPKIGYADVSYGDRANESLTGISWNGDIYECKSLQAADSSVGSIYSDFLGEDYAAVMDSLFETNWSINLTEGNFIVIENNSVIFTPYVGNDLGFRF